MRILKKSEQNFLATLFERYRQVELKALCLRNYEDLPERIGNDLDVFVSRSSFSKAEGILLSTLEEWNGKLLKKYRKDTFAAYWMTIDEGDPIHIDLFNGAFFWRGRRLLKSGLVLQSSKVSESGFPIPRPAYQAFSMFVTPLVWGGFCKVIYNDRIQELLADPEEMRVFRTIYSENFGTIDWQFSDFHSQDGPEAKRTSLSMRNNLRWRFISKCNPMEAFRIGRYWLWEVINLIRPAGSWKLAAVEHDACATKTNHSELFGAVRNLKWKGNGLISWLWFHTRYVRIYMARNELVIVSSKNQIKPLFIKLSPRVFESK